MAEVRDSVEGGFFLLAPVQVLNTLIHDFDDNEIEHVEHFKYKQTLERKLTVTSIIGLGFTLMGVPFGLSLTLWISLMDGANVTILYGWIVVSVFLLLVVLSLSEIISKYPSAGGVYHFSAILSSENYSLSCSWFTGWFLLIGNWTYALSIIFLGSQFILSIFGLKDSYYKEDRFLVLAVFFILLSFAGFVNFSCSKYLDGINKACIYWSIYTVLAIDVLLIFFAKRTNSIKDILTTFDNSRSGWPDPIAFLVGLQSSSFTMTGYGLLFAMTDEVKNPERNMPKGAITATLITSVTGLIFILPILTILPELNVILDTTPEIMPIDLVFKFATDSYIVSFLLTLLLVGTVLFQAIGTMTTASRTTYAFARDGGLPFQNLWLEVDDVHESRVPKNALFLSMFMCALLSLLSLILSSAFNAFLGASVVSLALANGIPIVCLMYNKRKKIKGAAFRLKYFGWIINGLSVFWVFILCIIVCLPPVIRQLNAVNMNYASVVLVGFIIMVTIGYQAWGRGSFHGPAIDTDYVELHNMEAASSQFVVHTDEDAEEGEGEEETKTASSSTYDGATIHTQSSPHGDAETSDTDTRTLANSDDPGKKLTLFEVNDNEY
ncbi:uncharacterized protein KQ657_002004 [Scheffersomyces spartinae]|uniref:Polyamine transporter TPO5 n=1 Tax=Scheffersomyces spartinae TaxID=45513 RepID=A0A9P7V6U1_9ASCO|nr:uncharacterized protein KQ657_002004 [Scheffersomyces spartinae]KAG7192285.1 hypothetical protein KQ657_002004 [Scheffersomyces spartinae]